MQKFAFVITWQIDGYGDEQACAIHALVDEFEMCWVGFLSKELIYNGLHAVVFQIFTQGKKQKRVDLIFVVISNYGCVCAVIVASRKQKEA